MKATIRSGSITIQRPAEDVFAFIAEMENSPLWVRTTVTTNDDDGSVEIGTTFQEESEVMGRVLKNRVEVTGIDRDCRSTYASSATGPFTCRVLVAQEEGSRFVREPQEHDGVS